MSKIVQAVNAMISNPNLITDVTEAGGELFFLYKNRYKWSMKKGEEGYWLWFYPGEIAFSSLIDMCAYGWQERPDMVTYNTMDIGTKEALSSFADLHSLLTEKVYGIDEVLDDIIYDPDIPF